MLTARPRLRRALPGAVALLAAAFLFSGCVTMDLESEFKDDGSGVHSMTVTIDTSMLGDLGESGELSTGFEDLDESAEAEGFTVEPIEEGDIVGAKITTEVDDSSDIGSVLNSLFNASAETTPDAGQTAEAASVPFSGIFEQDGGDYTLDLQVNGSAFNEEGSEEMGGELGMNPEQFFDLTYTVTMPGELDAENTNGTVLEDGRVQWQLPMSGNEQFTVASSTGDGSSTMLFLLAGGGILLLAAAGLIALGVFVFSNRRTPSPSQATSDETVLE